LTASYTDGGFSTYANFAYSVAKGENWNSSQFLFDPTDAAYVKNHWIYLDHDQRTSPARSARRISGKNPPHCSTRVYMDALYGSGLRTDGGGRASRPTIPNGSTVPAILLRQLGAEQSFKLDRNRLLKARLDVVNLTDNIYQLRSGSGVGVNAAQYGERLGFFGSLSYVF
jgi:hypothetical protein